MFRRAAGWAVVVFMSGCATVVPGRPLTKLPVGLEWCGAGPEEIVTPPVLPLLPENESVFSGWGMETCTPLLKAEVWDRYAWQGTVEYGLTTDAAGKITSICVYGGNYGNALGYVGCLAREMASANKTLEPNRDRLRYRMHFIAE